MKKMRTCSVFADGKALWVDSSLNKLESRKFTTDERPVVIDVERPVTLARLKDLAKHFDAKKIIEVWDWRWFSEDGTEVPSEKVRELGYSYSTRKEYHYIVKHNCLTIWEDGMPIYENDNGTICRDRVALADCLM